MYGRLETGLLAHFTCVEKHHKMCGVKDFVDFVAVVKSLVNRNGEPIFVFRENRGFCKRVYLFQGLRENDGQFHNNQHVTVGCV